MESQIILHNYMIFMFSYVALSYDSCYTCTGLARKPNKGAVPSLNSAVNPALNSQQAIYYSAKSRPEQTTETAR